LLLAASWLMACSCASGRVALSGVPGERVIVDGEEVFTAGDQTLLELLRRKVAGHRLGEQAPVAEQPLVLVDGVAMMDGARALAGIPAFHVVSVSLLRQTEAVPLYGPRARFGAIIVRTR
jgi:hypothetical protein